jgi:cytochrome c oxidase cbb3-type subunit 2
MKNLPLLFLGIFFTLAFSWAGLILSSQYQFGQLEPTTSTLDEDGNLMPGEISYPQTGSGIAQQGKRVYISEGCMYCHSQQVRPQGFGADFERLWGPRQSVPRDYILQERVLLGTMRTGPDLTNVGARAITPDWHHQHLYDPQITSPGSIMPSFSYLYEVKEIDGKPSENAIIVPEDSSYYPGEGYEVVPTAKANALVKYLLSLKINYELPEAKFTE